MATHSSTLAWKIPWMEEPGRLQSMGSLRVRYDWATSLSLFTFMHWRRKWQPTPVFLPGESQGLESLVGSLLWGCRIRHDWNDLAAAALAKIQSRVPCGNWELKWSCVPREKINLFGGHVAFSQLQCATYLLNPYTNPVNGFNILFFFPDEEIERLREVKWLIEDVKIMGGWWSEFNQSGCTVLEILLFSWENFQVQALCCAYHSVMSDSLWLHGL